MFTDKGSIHSYIPIYEQLFSNLNVTSLLEIGISTGASLYMFAQYFKNARITGIDISDKDLLLKNTQDLNIHMIFEDAYNSNTLSLLDTMYDIIIDDGSHKEYDFVKFLVLYMHKFNQILIIEDIYCLEICFFLLTLLPHELQKYVTVYDRRQVKSRYDDILFVINKHDVPHEPLLKTYVNENEYYVSTLYGRSIA